MIVTGILVSRNNSQLIDDVASDDGDFGGVWQLKATNENLVVGN